MNCTNCGAYNQDGSTVCSSCGANLAQQNSYNTQPQQPSYQPQQPQQGYQQPQQPAYGYQPQPQYGGYQQNPYGYGAPAEPAKGLAIGGLVCGILSLVFFAIILGPLGIILGGVAKSKGNTSPMATAGIVCGVIGVVSWLLLMIIGVGTFMAF